MILISVLAVGAQMYQDYHEDIQYQTRILHQLGRTAADRIGSKIRLIDSHLREILADLPREARTSPTALRVMAGSREAHELLRRRRHDLNNLDAFGLMDADGHLLNTSRFYPPPSPAPARAGGFYERLIDLSYAEPVIGDVTASIVTGQPTFLMARRIFGPDGELLGFIIAAIDVATLRDSEHEFMAFYGNAVSLSRADGTILMRNPDDPRIVGMRLTNPEWHRLVATGGGVLHSDGKPIGKPLYVSVMPVHGYPLAVNVHAYEDEVLWEWYRNAIPMSIVTVVAAIGFVLLFEALIRGVARQRKQNVQLTQQSEAVRVAEERFRDFAEMASDWFWEQDAECRYVDVSYSTLAFPHQRHNYHGKRRWELPDAFFEPEALERHKADVAARRPFRDFRYRSLTPEGRDFYSSISGRPYYDAAGEFAGYRGTGRNITAEVEAAKTLEDARDRAESANRAKSEFLATMSHEIRTPLNAVIGMAGLLMETPLSPEQRKDIQIINESGKSLLTLLNDILDLSKLEAGQVVLEKANFSIVDVFGNVVSLLGPQADAKGLRLSVGPHLASLPRLRGDVGRVGQILLNLVSNAIKFTERGSITMTAFPVRQADGGLLMRFEVTDTGIGIADEDKERLFNRFTQLDSGASRRFGGTGLGLAICRELASLMGGEIGVHSKLGEGSCFWFTARFVALPKWDRPPRSAVSATLPDAHSSPAKSRILVAEDNPANQRLMDIMLRRAGYHVDIVANGLEAVHAVASLPYDVVLMDVHMPEMDGVAATQAIRRADGGSRHIPIIALTADALSGDRDRYLQAGMDSYLAKPIDAKQLLELIGSYCARGDRDREPSPSDPEQEFIRTHVG